MNRKKKKKKKKKKNREKSRAHNSPTLTRTSRPDPRLIRTLATAAQQHQAGRLQEAETLYRQVLEMDPDNSEALHLMGILASSAGNSERAVQLLEKSILINPTDPIYHTNLASVLLKQGRKDQAIRHFHEALRLNPNYPEAHFGMAKALHDQNDLEAALRHFQMVLQLKPAHYQARLELGNVLHVLSRTEEAVEQYMETLRYAPNFPTAHFNLANAFLELHEYAKAIGHYQKALQLEPELADAHFNMSAALMHVGQVRTGWEEFEWRFKKNNPIRQITLPRPLWKGESLTGRSILVYAEQGIGDELLHASCFPDILSLAHHCFIECDRRLISLFSRSFPTATVGCSTNSDFSWISRQDDIDTYCAAGSLPRYVRPDLASFPDHSGYIIADPLRQQDNSARVRTLGPGLKVGISWRSGMTNAIRDQYKTSLTQWKPILLQPGIHFINLQYDDCTEELAAIKDALGVTVHSWNDIDLYNDLEAAAALTSVLDLVITAPTSVADMAGALGVPTWALFPVPSPKMLGTERMPWFPDMKVFTRGLKKPWEATIKEIVDELVNADKLSRLKIK